MPTIGKRATGMAAMSGTLFAPFEAIEVNYGLDESAVITLMRRELKPSSFRMWRKRVTNRVTKHAALRVPGHYKAYCPTQYKP